MIKFKNRPPAPPCLQTQRVRKLKDKIRENYETRGEVNSVDFVASVWQDEKVKTKLWRHQSGKCCYCERKRELKRESDVEHYRPKAEVAENNEHPGYWWLAYEWDNYLFACKPCNEAHKKSHFPLLVEDNRSFNSDDIHHEVPLLINPIDDDPEECIDFVWHDKDIFVKAVGIDDDGRGAKTIALTQLNRPELIDERAQLLLYLDSVATRMKVALERNNNTIIRKLTKDINMMTAKQNKFAGFIRAFFRHNMLSEYISNE